MKGRPAVKKSYAAAAEVEDEDDTTDTSECRRSEELFKAHNLLKSRVSSVNE